MEEKLWKSQLYKNLLVSSIFDGFKHNCSILLDVISYYLLTWIGKFCKRSSCFSLFDLLFGHESSPPPVLNGQYEARCNTYQNQIKSIYLFDILFQVLKVLLIKNYKVQLRVLLFLVLLNQSWHHEILFFTTFENFIQHYLKKSFCQSFSFWTDSTKPPTHLAGKVC